MVTIMLKRVAQSRIAVVEESGFSLRNTSMLTVRPIKAAHDTETFLRLPWSLYADDPNWVPPLLSELRARLDTRKNPYFEHAQAAMFLAERNGKPVGRITAQICQLAQKHQREGDGHFGFFECEASQATADALFAAAEAWLAARGMQRMVGPFNFSIYDEAGLLIDGFHRPPSVFMGHNLPSYDQLFQGSGFEKEMDVYAYYIDIQKEYNERIQRILQATRRNTNIHLRCVDKRHLNKDLEGLMQLFNESWADNWGHVPMTKAEVNELGKLVRRLFNTDAIVLAEIDGQVAGFIVIIPNLNEIIRDLNGKLFPLGWLKLLYRLKFSKCSSVRMPLMGVRKDLHNTSTGAAIVFQMIDRCREMNLPKGVKHCEFSWILETNTAMRDILCAWGTELDKTYRIYSKPLSPISRTLTMGSSVVPATHLLDTVASGSVQRARGEAMPGVSNYQRQP
jgi:hypothetical protein